MCVITYILLFGSLTVTAINLNVQCTVTCGGGLRSRSIQCLDEDGVIVQDCDYDNRPSSYQFCGQIDCNSLGMYQ